MIGKTLSHYEIIAPLGAGGMGEVYRARDTKLERDVAIKVLPDDLAADPDRLARFEREAKLLAALSHANIGAIHGLEESGGVRFLVLELIEGETLEQRLRKGAIPVPEALDIARQIAEALEAAHDAGIIHRDVKPANVLLTGKGGVKVLDFGIAKSTTVEANAKLTEQATSLTIDGTLMGTPPYMAPEQIRGEEADKRADIWAFGCVVYEMLTGRGAFVRETVADTLVAVLEAEPDWGALPRGTAGEVVALLRRCLRKDPNRRLHDIADARIEVQEAAGQERATEEDASGAADERARRLSLPLVLAVVLAGSVAASAVTWIVARSTGTPAPVMRTTIGLEPGSTPRRWVASSVAISPLGDRVVFAATKGGVTQLYSRSLSDLTAETIPGTEGASSPFFSADGTWVGFLQGDSMRKIPLRGGASSLIAEGVGSTRGASWGSDHRIVFTPGNLAGLWEVDAEGGEPRALTEPDGAAREKTHRLPEVLPGGEAVLFTLPTVDDESWGDTAIAVFSRDTGTYEILVQGGTNPRYSASGHLLYARNGSILAVPFDVDTLEISGTPVTIADNVATSALYGSADFAVANEGNGTLVYARGGSWGDQRRVVVIGADGSVEPLIDETRAFAEAHLSRDRTKVAVVIEGVNPSIWVYLIARNILTKLTSGFDNDVLAWHPDDVHLAFRSNRKGNYDIYLQAADGTQAAELLLEGESRFDPWSWSDTGWLGYEHDGDIWAWSRETPLGRRLFETEEVEREPSLSPNGRWVAYSANDTRRREVYVRSFPDMGARQQVSNAGGFQPCWSDDSRRLFYREGNRIMAVDVEPSLGSPDFVVEHEFPATSWGFDCASDGRFVVIQDVEASARASELVLVQNLFHLIEQRMSER